MKEKKVNNFINRYIGRYIVDFELLLKDDYDCNYVGTILNIIYTGPEDLIAVTYVPAYNDNNDYIIRYFNNKSDFEESVLNLKSSNSLNVLFATCEKDILKDIANDYKKELNKRRQLNIITTEQKVLNEILIYKKTQVINLYDCNNISNKDDNENNYVNPYTNFRGLVGKTIFEINKKNPRIYKVDKIDKCGNIYVYENAYDCTFNKYVAFGKSYFYNNEKFDKEKFFIVDDKLVELLEFCYKNFGVGTISLIFTFNLHKDIISNYELLWCLTDIKDKCYLK